MSRNPRRVRGLQRLLAEEAAAICSGVGRTPVYRFELFGRLQCYHLRTGDDDVCPPPWRLRSTASPRHRDSVENHFGRGDFTFR